MALTLVIFGSLDAVASMPVIKVFLLVMRDSKMNPIAITAISATLITVLYVKFRMLLFIMIEVLSSATGL